eukprot:346644_1
MSAFDIFKSKKQQFILVSGYIRISTSHYIHNDIIGIVYTFYYIIYNILDSMGIEYHGLEHGLSKLFRNVVAFEKVSSGLRPYILKYKPKCILLYGSNGNNAFKIAYELNKLLTDQEPFVADVSSLSIYPTADAYHLCIAIAQWIEKINAQNQLGVLIVNAIEQYQYDRYTCLPVLTNDDIWVWMKQAETCSAMQSCIQYILSVAKDNILVIGIANNITDVNTLPKLLLKANHFDCQIQINTPENVSNVIRTQLDALEIPIGMDLLFIKESNDIYHHSVKLTQIIELAKHVSNRMKNTKVDRMNKISMLIYGNDKCGKTSVASYIALNIEFDVVIRLEFNKYNMIFEYQKILKYVRDVFEIVYNSKMTCVIVIDDFHVLLEPWVKIDPKYDVNYTAIERYKANPILIGLLALMKKKSYDSKLFIIATCEYNMYCKELNINQYFDFVKKIPDGIIKSREGMKFVLNKSEMFDFCQQNMDTILDSIENVVRYNKRFNISDLFQLFEECKYKHGYIDALWLILRNLPFYTCFNKLSLF